jgi:hypothetical protein
MYEWSEDKKNPAAFATGLFSIFSCVLNLHNVGSLVALGTLGHIELDRLAFIQRLVSLALDRGVMHEYIGAAITGNESKSFFIVEPFYFSINHG